MTPIDWSHTWKLSAPVLTGRRPEIWSQFIAISQAVGPRFPSLAMLWPSETTSTLAKVAPVLRLNHERTIRVRVFMAWNQKGFPI